MSDTMSNIARHGLKPANPDTSRLIFTFVGGCCGIGLGTALREGEWVAASVMALALVILTVGRAIFEAILHVAKELGKDETMGGVG